MAHWLSSSIFPCLFFRSSVRPAMLTSHRISIFFNIFTHKSLVLTQFHLILNSTKLYRPSTTIYQPVLTHFDIYKLSQLTWCLGGVVARHCLNPLLTVCQKTKECILQKDSNPPLVIYLFRNKMHCNFFTLVSCVIFTYELFFSKGLAVLNLLEQLNSAMLLWFGAP